MRLLLKAAQDGDVAAIRRRLDAGVSVNAVASNDDSPLVLAVMFGHLEATRVLLDAGADVNHHGLSGHTALHFAARRSIALTELLLSRGADANARNNGDQTALEEFLFHAHDRKLDLGIIDALVAGGLDLKQRGTKYAGRGRSPLALAASVGHAPAVEKLAALGLDVNEGTPPGQHVFDLALRCRDEAARREVFATLVRLGIDARVGDRFGFETLLTAVCRVRDFETAKRLLDRGADPNGRARTTALAIAEELGDQALIDLLLESGAKSPRPPLAPEAAAELDAALREASELPGDPVRRARHARALHAAGFHAAAAAEAQAAGIEGGDLPGTPWRFVDFVPPVEGLAPRVRDELFPNARVTDGTLTLPLVLAQCPPCTRCDAARTVECSTCHGTGKRTGFLDDDTEYDCEVRTPCGWCGQSGRVVSHSVMGKGACRHPGWREEARTADFALRRCEACSLSAVKAPAFDWITACASCGRIACSCRG